MRTSALRAISLSNSPGSGLIRVSRVGARVNRPAPTDQSHLLNTVVSQEALPLFVKKFATPVPEEWKGLSEIVTKMP